MASVDTEAEMALRARTREELADKAEKLLEQSRTLKDRLTKSLADRSQLEEGEKAEEQVVVDVQEQPSRSNKNFVVGSVLAFGILLLCAAVLTVLIVYVW